MVQWYYQNCQGAAGLRRRPVRRNLYEPNSITGLAPLAALMALLLRWQGVRQLLHRGAGTASQTKYATGKYTQTEVTPAVDSGFAPAKLQMLDGVPTLSLYNDAQNTAAAFSWTGDGWETIDPSTVQAFLDGLDKTQVETLTACYRRQPAGGGWPPPRPAAR